MSMYNCKTIAWSTHKHYYTSTSWLWSTPSPISLTSPGAPSIESVARVTAVVSYTTHAQCWIRVGDCPIGQRERGAQHCRVGVAKLVEQSPPHTMSTLTNVSTESHLSSSSWYHTTVGTSWCKGIESTSTSHSDHLGGIPHSVETLSISCWVSNGLNHPPIRIVPLSPSSLTSSVTVSTTLSQVSVTGERGKTTRSILSNVSDEDLSVVGGDVGWSQGQISYMANYTNISL